jgi:hypothetical protein
MAIPVHTKDTLSNVAWPTPPTNKITSTNATGPDRIIEGRLPYRRVGAKTDDPLMRNKPRVIIPHNGRSFAAPPLTVAINPL